MVIWSGFSLKYWSETIEEDLYTPYVDNFSP